MYLCSENKGTDQLHRYCAVDLHLCFFCTCEKKVLSLCCLLKAVFLMMQLIFLNSVESTLLEHANTYA